MSEETLFPVEEQMRRDASISPDGRYRWSLHRDWYDATARRRWVTFVMLNPSTADANEDDPTIRRCIGFAKSLGATGLAVVNLYAFRATRPTDLWAAEDPVGSRNDETLAMFFAMAARHDFPIIAGWGTHAKPDRVAAVLAMPGAERLQALRVTQSGAPGHPLYLPSTAAPQPWPADQKCPNLPECPVCPGHELIDSIGDDGSESGYFCTECTAWFSFDDLASGYGASPGGTR